MTLTGLFIPLITPFDDDGSVALAALESLAIDALEAGATGLVALGTTGEPTSLTEAERRSVVEVVDAVCRARSAPLLVGASTVEALRAVPASAAAALSLVPPFVRPGEEGVVAWFAQLAASAPVPLVVYNIPHRTAQRLSVATLRRLAELPGVIGVKHSVGGVTADTVALLADPPLSDPPFAVLCGDDPFISPLLALGADGGILASAHVSTAAFAALIAAWRAGDVAAARPLGARLAGLSSALFAEPNPTVIKAVLHAQGRVPTPSVRLPLLPAQPQTTAAALALARDGAL